VRWIAEQRKVELPLVTEFLESLHGVGAGSEYGDTQLVELRFCVTKLGRFDRSTRSIRFRKKEQQDTPALEVF